MKYRKTDGSLKYTESYTSAYPLTTTHLNNTTFSLRKKNKNKSSSRSMTVDQIYTN